MQMLLNFIFPLYVVVLSLMVAYLLKNIVMKNSSIPWSLVCIGNVETCIGLGRDDM
ncbi:hypothetical protein Sjap_004878 [Stephania japonica]|uniref:Uncharacterized protein n=1 Tax=Stephania japonica TaxID=461633 RepID=A0AAP0K5E3_9MAGN